MSGPAAWLSPGSAITVIGIGDSYCVGAVADGTKGGTTVQTGVTSTLTGATQATWVNPTCSWWPYMVDSMITQSGGSISGARVVRRGQVGLLSGANTDTHVASLRDDLTGFGSPVVDVCVIALGINNANSQANHDIYVGEGEGGLRRLLDRMRAEFPLTRFILTGQLTNTPASYPFLPQIEAHKVSVAASYPYTRYVDVADLSAHLSDAVHLGASGNAILGPRIAAAWLA